MPIQYPSGTLAEHRACRTGAAAFDVSHLGTVRVTGAAFDRLQGASPPTWARSAPAAPSTPTCSTRRRRSSTTSSCGGWRTPVRRHAQRFNTDRVRDAIGGEDVTASRAVIAVQGPEAWARLAGVAGGGGRRAPPGGARRGAGSPVRGGRHRLHGRGRRRAGRARRAAGEVWDAVVAAGVTPAGLGARDTLRLEAAYASTATSWPRHHPVAGRAGLGGGVGQGGGFQGHDALAAERERGVARRLRGLSVAGRRPGRVPGGGGRRAGGGRTATSRPRWSGASRWPSCPRRSGREPRCRSTSGGPRAGHCGPHTVLFTAEPLTGAVVS